MRSAGLLVLPDDAEFTIPPHEPAECAPCLPVQSHSDAADLQSEARVMVFFLDALRLCAQYTHLLMLELPLVLSIVWLPSSPPLDARGPYLRRSDAVAMCLCAISGLWRWRWWCARPPRVIHVRCCTIAALTVAHRATRSRSLGSCTLSLVVYSLLSSGTLHRRNLAFHGTPHVLTMEPSLGP